MNGANILRYAAALIVLGLVGATALSAQSVTLGQTIGGQVPADDVQQGATDHWTVGFALNVAGGAGGTSSTFTGLTFTNNGTADDTDYIRYRLYSVPLTGTPTVLAESVSPNEEFTGFSEVLGMGQHNFLITVDVDAAATVNNTFQISVATTDVTTTGTVTGTTQNGGTQTIVAGSGISMEVRRGSAVIAHAGNDNLGNVSTNGQIFTYTIENTSNSGDLILDTNPVSILMPQNVTVTVTQPTTLILAPGLTTTFGLEVEPNSAAQFGFAVTIDNNGINDPYLFSVDGTGVAPGGSATQLVIVTQPGNGTGGSTLSQTPVVEAWDANDDLVTSYTENVTATIVVGSGTGGATVINATVAASGGIADFSQLAIDLAGTDYRLEFSDGTLTSAQSDQFDITVGPVAEIVIVTQPPTLASGGEIWAAQPSLQTRDAGGNHTTTDNSTQVDVELIGGTTGATLLGTLTATAAAGNIDFTGLGIDLVGTGYQLEFTATIDGSPVLRTSTDIEIETGPAAGLMIVDQPGGAVVNEAFTTQPLLHIVDAGGNHVDTDNGTAVTADLVAGPSATLGGTLSVDSVDGVVEFTDLEIDTVGTGYVIEFSSSLGDLDSAPFNVAGAATQLGITAQPGRAFAGSAMLDAPVIEVQDATGSLVSSDNSTEIEVSVQAGAVTLSGTTVVQVVNGVATFDNLIVDDPELDVILTFSDVTNTPALTPVDSDEFDVVGPGEELVITTQPSDAEPNDVFPNAVVLEVRDANGLLVFNDNTTEVEVSILAGSGEQGAALGGTLTRTAVDGVLTFDDLSIDLEGDAYRLLFEDDASILDPDVSDEFDVFTGATSTGGGSSSSSDDGCSTGEGTSLTLLLVLLALGGAAALRVRRRTA
jgi:MYXO-CTERM domain-containing protein